MAVVAAVGSAEADSAAVPVAVVAGSVEADSVVVPVVDSAEEAPEADSVGLVVVSEAVVAVEGNRALLGRNTRLRRYLYSKLLSICASPCGTLNIII